MEAYPKKYERLLKEGEKVLWYKKGDAPIPKILFIILLVVFGRFIIPFLIEELFCPRMLL
jgi:hypothetical protein